MSSFATKCLSFDKTIRFAAEELQKYVRKIDHHTDFTFVLGLVSDFMNNGLMKCSRIRVGDIDAFEIVRDNQNISIIGSNPRSVLFGVYHVCKYLFGYRWVSFFDEDQGVFRPQPTDLTGVFQADLKRRGLVIEYYDDPDFILKIIDWAPKHYINELFFTYILWDKIKWLVKDEISKRGLHLTLGGHSLHFLLENHEMPVSKQLDFQDLSWQEILIGKLKKYCEETEEIDRVSLWPPDIGVKNKRFLSDYLSFIARIQNCLPNIKAEHIAYNAGLSWEMLELNEYIDRPYPVDTLFAFWGRNYGQPYHKEERACNALQDWRKKTAEQNQELCILEYYSDHFMLSELFPPLFQRINEDMAFYKNLQIDGIVNLIVPFVPKNNADRLDVIYPWKDVQLMNAYYFARLAWGDDYCSIEKDFYSVFGEKEEQWKQRFKQLEEVLSHVSKWNVPLFPYRPVDPGKANVSSAAKLIKDLKIRKEKMKDVFVQIDGGVPEKLLKMQDVGKLYIYYVYKKLENLEAIWLKKLDVKDVSYE